MGVPLFAVQNAVDIQEHNRLVHLSLSLYKDTNLGEAKTASPKDEQLRVGHNAERAFKAAGRSS